MIVIPMAGNSSRFFAAGFTRPKYEIESHGRPLFDWSLRSFEHYFPTEQFVFVTREEFDARDFVSEACSRIGLKFFDIVELAAPTRGQAETVFKGLERLLPEAASESLTIFNIDTIRPNFRFAPNYRDCDGCLEVFRGTGANWSFVKASNARGCGVAEVAEKRPISDLCSTGLYWFRSAALFAAAYKRAASSSAYIDQWRELYVAPLYNYMIEDKALVNFQQIEAAEVVFVGTPEELARFDAGIAPF